MFLGVLGGTGQYWAQSGHAYRAAWLEAGHPAEAADIAVAMHGFVADSDAQARETFLEYEGRMFEEGMAELGRTAAPRSSRAAAYDRGGMVFVGSPNEIADRTLDLHEMLGHSRQIIQMDVGGMPQATVLKSIELLGSQVLPQVRAALSSS
jgi:alkanesulfonate monooxygenase SsuD/methylene tetrahydromethanopterin reductase-like flavin-dependent oxidoreductase (luciferase family)